MAIYPSNSRDSNNPSKTDAQPAFAALRPLLRLLACEAAREAITQTADRTGDPQDESVPSSHGGTE